MTTLSDREKAFENKFAHDQELKFQLEVRRNRLVARWAADLLGKSETEVETYVTEVIKADFAEPGIDDVVRKLVTDLDGLADEPTIRAQFETCLATARAQMIDET